MGPCTILVNAGAGSALPAAGLGLYVAVSPHDPRSDLERQLARLTRWEAQAGQPVVRVESEVGSGMNGHLSELRRLLWDPKVTTVVVEQRDRLARINAELVEASLLSQGRWLGVLDQGEVEDDLAQEIVEVLTGLCARLYGWRPARNRALKAINCAQHDMGPEALAQPPSPAPTSRPAVPSAGGLRVMSQSLAPGPGPTGWAGRLSGLTNQGRT